MKENLIKIAGQIKAPSKSSALEFEKKSELLAAEGSRILNQRPDLEKLVGKGNKTMAEDNNRNFSRFMASLFMDYNADVFVNTVIWVFRAYRAHGFQTTYWAANLNIWADILKKELSEHAYEELYPFYNWLIINIPVFTGLTDSEQDDEEVIK